MAAVVLHAIPASAASPSSLDFAAAAVNYRINSGGAQLSGTPVWSPDTASNPSPYTNTAASGSQVFASTSTIDMTHPSLPTGTPLAMLQTERYDPPTGAEMQWDFPVTPGPYEVRLYFAETFSGAQSVGARVFDVTIEGSVLLNDYDTFADVGANKGVMKSFAVTSDSNLDVDFAHVVENPAIKGIEILGTGSAANTLGAQPSSISFGSVTVGSSGSQALQVTNLGGTGDPNIVVNSTTITGSHPNQFSDNFDDGSNVTLSPGQSTTINVTFSPTSEGSKSATLAISHSGSNNPLTVPLSGSGLAVLAGAWETRAPSGLNRQEVSYVQVGGKFYLAGGSTAHQVYDPQTNAWSNAAPLPQKLDHIQGAVVGGKIYYIGGLSAFPSPHVATVYIYDPQTNSFTQGAQMPSTRARGAGGVAVHQGKIYYAGGLHNGSAVSMFDVYDPQANTWTQLPNMPRVRDHFHAAVVGGKFYAIGGRNTTIDATTTANDAYDFSTGSWAQGLAPLPTARGGFATGVLGNEIVIIGGEGGGNTYNKVEAYNTQANTWRTLAPMPTARHGIQAAECNGGLYIAAGGKTQGGSNPSDVHEVFFLDGAKPCAGASPPTAHHRVNTGGAQISGTPSWTADTATSPSPYTNVGASGSKTFETSSSIDMTHPSLPSGTPQAMLQTERWDPPTGAEMQWDFPVTSGAYEVRLYFAEIFSGANSVGARVFDVSIEGAVVLNDYDVYADVGANKGVMKSFAVTSDSNLDIDFGHVVENPTIKGIEIISAGSAADTLGAQPSSITFGSVTVGSSGSQSLQVTNLGDTGDPSIVVSSTTITGSHPNQFSDNFNDGSNVTLTPGQSTTINVIFSPTSDGAKSATLAISHSGSNDPLTVPLSGTGVTSVPVGFGKSLLKNETSSLPTTLQFGPDGKLYVGQFDGTIKVYDVKRNGANDYTVTATQTISLVKNIPNHNDNGALNTSVNTRIVTGLLVTGTAANPVIYVTSSDPRIGAGPSGGDLNLDTNSSMLSRLTWTGSSWAKLDLVRGLPRSEENHSANGMALDIGTNTLYVAQGGNTNQGAPSNNFALLPEFALAAAILSVDLAAIGNSTYDVPTLDDEDRSGVNDANDPFGGNNGKNQAKLVAGGPVKVHAPGFRNAYDLVITSAGKMYTIDNGGNAGWGGVPVNEGPGGNCTNQINEPGTTDPDSLHLITGSGYYGGHPNPTRGNTANKFNSSNPQSPVPSANPIECDYRKPGPESGALTTFPGSTNGIHEYAASNFGGAMRGNLLAAGYSANAVYRIQLNSDGTAATSNTALFSAVGSQPLDITSQGDNGAFPGTLWVADIGNGNIYVFEPNDFGSTPPPPCTGAYDWALDEDEDKFKNADELDNGTDPCSAGDLPPDADGDFLSDLNDPDDDNDGSPDTADPFARDPNNGTSTFMPVSYTWDNGAPPAGGIMGLGFTGLMTNKVDDYLSLFDAEGMTAGGAAGVTTIDEVPAGDALGTSNTQQFGFQFGVNANPQTTGKFTAHTRVLAPFAGLSPQDNQSMGLFIGNGDQDNYVKIVTLANGGAGGVQFVKEVASSTTASPQDSVAMPGPDYVDLYLTVDPAANTVQPSYTVTTGGTAGPKTNLGGPEPIPAGWLTGTTGLAVGIISTSSGPGPVFPATWDFIEVAPDEPPSPPQNEIALDNFGRAVSSGWGTADVGGPWSVLNGQASNFSVGGGIGSIVTPANANQQVAHLGSVSALNVDYKAKMTFPGNPGASNGHFGYLLLRRQSGGANLRVGLYVAGGNVYIRGQNQAGTNLFADVNTGLGFSPGDSINLRVQAEGANPTTVRARAWKAGTTEPSSWAVNTTTTVGPQTAGSIGVRTLNQGATSTTISFDDLVASQIGSG
jgi:N-acetylneuraminic acid mutarotase